MNAKQKQKLRKFIKELDVYRGRHTEFVSVYIPADYELIKIIQHLQQEQGTAENIKDKNTRLHVIDSLEKMIRHLRLYKKTPDNGLAAFSGNIAAQEGKTDIKIWSVEPPQPLNFRAYRCDQTFLLDPLKEMLEYKDVYGLIVLDNREATIGVSRRTMINEIMHMTSAVPGKIKAGGFSQARFARLREEAAHEFYKRVADVANKEFMGNKDLKGILVGGPGPTKETFFDGSYLFTELKRKVLAVKDIGYTDSEGLHELVEKSQDVLHEEEIAKEKKVMQEFFKLLAKESNKTAYGKDAVKEALKLGSVDTLLLS